jgi:hypothetical protein
MLRGAAGAIALDMLPTLVQAGAQLYIAKLQEKVFCRDFAKNVVPHIEPGLKDQVGEVDALRADITKLPLFFANISYKIHYETVTVPTVSGSFEAGPSFWSTCEEVFQRTEFVSVTVSREPEYSTRLVSPHVLFATYAEPLIVELTAEEFERFRERIVAVITRLGIAYLPHLRDLFAFPGVE